MGGVRKSQWNGGKKNYVNQNTKFFNFKEDSFFLIYDLTRTYRTTKQLVTMHTVSLCLPGVFLHSNLFLA